MTGHPVRLESPAPRHQDRAPTMVPARVLAIAAGRQPRLVWHNEDALTYEAGDGAGRCFVKWSPVTSSIDLTQEGERMAWAGACHPVPQVLALGADDHGSWLVTAALAGHARDVARRRLPVLLDGRAPGGKGACVPPLPG